MAQLKTKLRVSKRQLQKYVDELIALAKTVTPDVQASYQTPGYEGQHARLEIYVPDELEEQLYELISQRAHDIFIDTGYDIAALVYEKSELQAEETCATPDLNGHATYAA